jgi:hypothetical protein
MVKEKDVSTVVNFYLDCNIDFLFSRFSTGAQWLYGALQFYP